MTVGVLAALCYAIPHDAIFLRYCTIPYCTLLHHMLGSDPKQESGRRCNTRAHGASAACQRSFPLLDAARLVDFRILYLVVYVSYLSVCK